MGFDLGHGISDYNDLVEEDCRYKAQIKEQLKKKKRNLKARDIAKAIIRSEKQAINSNVDVDETDPEIQSSSSRIG